MLNQHLSEEMVELYCLGRLPEGLVAIVEEHLLLCEACQDQSEKTLDFLQTILPFLSERPRSSSNPTLDRADGEKRREVRNSMESIGQLVRPGESTPSTIWLKDLSLHGIGFLVSHGVRVNETAKIMAEGVMMRVVIRHSTKTPIDGKFLVGAELAAH